jgi:hypothetical protein
LVAAGVPWGVPTTMLWRTHACSVIWFPEMLRLLSLPASTKS